MTRKISELGRMTNVFLPVELTTTELKKPVTKIYCPVYNHTFPSKNIIISKTYIFNNHVFMNYYDESGTKRCVSVPKDFELIVREKPTKKQKELIKTIKDGIRKNLRSNLGARCNVGSDPEIFIEDEKGDIIPAFEFLGTKENPKHFGVSHVYGSNKIFWDGFQAEFTTSPQNCLAWQVDSVHYGLKGLIDAARKYNKKAKLSGKTVFYIDFDVLDKTANNHVAFGCNPVLNVYGMEGIFLGPRETPYRSAGGHIHFGLGELEKNESEAIVKALDAILGVACVSLFAQFDDPMRRQMYGLAGEYRLPKHGLEYRVLSNAWLCHPLIMNMVFDLSRRVVNFGRLGMRDYYKVDQDEVIRIINECDVNAARGVLTKNKKLLLDLINATYHSEKTSEMVYGAFLNGVESVVKNPTDIENNWCLNKGQTWITHSDGTGKNASTSVGIVISKKGKVA